MEGKTSVVVVILAVSLLSFLQPYTASGQFFTTQISTTTQILTGTSTARSKVGITTYSVTSTTLTPTTVFATVTTSFRATSTSIATSTTTKTVAVTVTNTNFVPVPPNPFPSGRTVGFIGCSNTYQSIVGYQTVVNQTHAQDHLWDAYNTGDGTLDQWANPSSTFWTQYQQQVAGYGQPKIVWIQICEHSYAPLTAAMLNETIANLRSMSPNAVIYISPLNTYNPVGLCSATGPNGVQDATTLANLAVSEGLALPGPILGPVTVQTLGADQCHLNSAGETLVGNQLVAFFNGQGIY